MFRTDISWASLKKFGEELCGDRVEVVQHPREAIIVLADGLGSGVKANILSTLTTKIAATMLKEGSSIEETVQTIVSTLPICKVRKIAYSTFTIIRVDSKGNCYIAEYGNPPVFFLKDGKVNKIKGEKRLIAGKEVMETYFKADEDDMIIAVSDGVVHAGVGGLLNLGWQRDNISKYIDKVYKKESSAESIVKLLTMVTSNFYMDKPGDDATVVAIKVIRPRNVTLFTGPPENPKDDIKLVKELMAEPNKKVICGGTAAQIVSRIIGEELKTSIDFIDPRIPPTAELKGIDLVTEGVLTLARVREILSKYISVDEKFKQLDKKDGATKLAKVLIDATDIKFLLGRAINPAHQNSDFPKDLSIKLNIAKEIINLLDKMGKNVQVKYY